MPLQYPSYLLMSTLYFEEAKYATDLNPSINYTKILT